METTYRRYPIGIQNFEQLRNNNCVYIDKTELIYKLTHSDSVYFLSRPRRFGKSLLVSTLEAYFQGKKHLFEGLAMERLETEWTEYPVLHMDFSRRKYTDADKLSELLNIQISHWEELYGSDKYGRTVHSLIAALSRYTGIKLVLISPKELRIPGYVKHGHMEEAHMDYVETASLDEAMPSLDILYMTRIQRERFSDPEQYERLKDSYILTADKLENAKPDLAILHPLPRVNEISVQVDADPRACYFKQVYNGKFVRMALILMLLEEAAKNPVPEIREEDCVRNTVRCNNPRCITSVEQELDHVFRPVVPEKGLYRCIYCERKGFID